MEVTQRDAASAPRVRESRALGPDLTVAVAGAIPVGLMLVWVIHNGGYDADTWYWGALVTLALLAGVVIARGPRAVRLSPAGVVALGAFALYVAWSYLSITWAASPGDALTGSNRVLLYLLVLATMLVLPWTVRSALTALLAFTLGVGVVAVVLLVRLASADHVAALVIDGRLAAPTGYFNATAALFEIEALTAIALASRRELPGLLRGALIGFGCAGLQLAVIVQSRGWLFTLPLILIAAIVLLPDRLRVAAAAVLPALATLAIVHRLLHVYQATPGVPLNHASSLAGHSALLSCGLAFLAGTLIAWGESLVPAPRPNPLRRRLLGSVVVVLACGAAIAGGLAVSHGHPFRFVSRQLHGFSHQESGHASSHFADVGSGRYDFWRVALDAFVAHPIGGLGQDNFDNYYVARRHTSEEPSWTHSLEFRLLAHTGLVGTALFALFLIAAVAAALPARRRRGLEAAVAGAALLPLVVWLIYGSVDWFWEFPALSGPALGFLGVAAALGARAPAGGAATADMPMTPVTSLTPATTAMPAAGPTQRRPRWGIRLATGAAGAVTMTAAVIVLAFPYLSVRETSIASDLRQRDPAAAVHALGIAADLNPLSADPGRLAGTIALTSQSYATAIQRFGQATSRDPAGWYAWFGAGLAQSALGNRVRARQDFERAAAINPKEQVIGRALAQVDSADPLSPAAGLQLLALSL